MNSAYSGTFEIDTQPDKKPKKSGGKRLCCLVEEFIAI